MRSIVSVILVPLLIASAQQPAATQQKSPEQVKGGGVKFESTVQLVVVDTYVKDKDGKPIPNLKASDFTLTEDGKAQKITVCEYSQIEETVLPEPELKPRPEPAAAPVAPAVKPPVVANQIAPAKPGEIKYKDRRLLVMFFDQSSMPIQDQLRAQAAATKFLKTQMQQSDLMAIMVNTNDLKVLQDFTDDRDQLQKIIKGLTVGEGSDLAVDGSTGGDNEEDTGAAFTADDTEFNIFNTDRKLAALETASKMLSSLPEKKALVYFASGVSKTGMDNEAQLRATINAAIRSNVSFYPIDARGLVASAPLGDATKGSPGNSGMYSGSSARSQQNQFQGQQETLFTLAADTGGKALLDNNDLGLGIKQAQKDISSYYILGYMTSTPLDGRFHKLKVTINNNLQAKLDFRPGYYAGKQFKQFNSSDRERQLQEALMLGDPVTDLSIAGLEIDFFRLARDRYYVPMTVKIPGSELELARHGGAETTKLDFIGQIKDAKGNLVAPVRDEISVKLKDSTAAQLAKTTLAYDAGFALPPGSYTVKFLARENETGKMGTYERKFVVPDLTAELRRLPISSVVLSSQREKLDAAVATAERDKKLLNLSPLVENGQKLVPSVTNVFRKNQDLFVYLEAYQPQADATEPIVATLSFYRGKVKAFETAPLQITEGLNLKSKALPVRFSVPLAKLQSGRYTCQVSVFDPGAQKFAFWRAPIAVLP